MALTKTPIELSSTPGIVDNSNTTAITIDASENVGIGVSSPSDYYATNLVVTGPSEGGITIASTGNHTNYLLFADSTSGVARYAGMIEYAHSLDQMAFRTNSIQRMAIDSTGAIISSMAGGVFLKNSSGGTSATQILVSNTGGSMRAGVESSSGGSIQTGTSAYAAVFGNQGNYPTQFTTNGTVKATIDSSGRFLVNTTSILSGTSAKLQVLQDIGGQWSQRINNSSSTPFGLTLSYTGASPNNTSSHFIYCDDTAAARFFVNSNGNVGSATNSYGSTSDLKLKENIVDAGSQWDDLKAVRVRKYSFKEENSSEPTQLGVIAQEVEAAGMAGLVYETADQEIAEDGSFVDTGEVTKTMKYSILYMKAIKALQEAMTRIETLEAKVQTLENN